MITIREFAYSSLYQTAPNTRTTEGKKNMLKKIRSRIDDSLDELNCKRYVTQFNNLKKIQTSGDYLKLQY